MAPSTLCRRFLWTSQSFSRLSPIILFLIGCQASLFAQPATDTHSQKLKDEMRVPWQRSGTRFLRSWLILGPVPGSLDRDVLQSVGGEAAQTPNEGQEVKLPSIPPLSWHKTKAWGDIVSLDQPTTQAGESVSYAFAQVTREKEGKALLSVGSQDGVCVWVNGQPVLSRDAKRSLTNDEDRLEIDLHSGQNALLVKVSCNHGPGLFCARILESGTLFPRIAEIGPSLLEDGPNGFILKTDVAPPQDNAAEVQVEVVAPGGKVVFSEKSARGVSLKVNGQKWPDGPYEVRCSTHKTDGLLFVQHLAWYKGNCLLKTAELVRSAESSNASSAEGMTLRMLVEMVEDRLGAKISEAKNNPWAKIHSPLMEFDELMLEHQGIGSARVRADGFYRLAYRDEIDGSPQFCRAYLPAHYSAAKKWPLVIQMHGFNPGNPRYVGWWAADSRHSGIAAEFPGHQEVIYMEVHGRGNAGYVYLGDQDVVRALAEAKKHFSVDEDRVYLTGDSMGGWGTWNIGTRHPELFAAIAPVFGGADYHVDLTEEQLAKLDPGRRFYQERASSWSTADSLLNLPIFVHHGDVDQSVNIDYSRWGVRMLQRWGYDVRYHEYPGYGHESLLGEGNAAVSIEWFLGHTRNANPAHVRVRSADLRTAQAYWVRVDQMESPAAFMVVDAEVVNRSTLRLNTQNIQALTLSPAASLIDPAKPLRVVWNGETRDTRVEQGRVQLLAKGTVLDGLVKRPALPGSLVDIISTPFAIVIGTSAADPELREQCQKKAVAFAGYWREWQKQEPRLFKDTDMNEADIARYSLLLVGGPGENLVTARLIHQLPFTVSSEGFVIAGRSFPAKDAVLHLIYPNPLNPDRYVRIVAPTSAESMYFVEDNFANYREPESPYFFDFVIQDPRLPVGGLNASPDQVRVLSGYFDTHWKISDALLLKGDEAVRAKCRVLHPAKKDYVLDPALVADYQGTYQIEKGPIFLVSGDSGRLVLHVNGASFPLSSETTSDFFIPELNIHLGFTRDAAGRVSGLTGFDGRQEFTAIRQEK